MVSRRGAQMFRYGSWLAGLALSSWLGACAPDAEDGPDRGVAAIDAAIDAAAAASCVRHADCSDGRFCNGVERCVTANDDGGATRCAPAEHAACANPDLCDEAAQLCLPDCRANPNADGDTQWDVRCGGTDCDDNDANVFRGATETCDRDGRDEDCDPRTLHGELARDGDQDGDGHVWDQCCNFVQRGDGKMILRCGDDCDDAHSNVNPGQLESPTCDRIDTNCDGTDCAPCTCGIPRAFFDCPVAPDQCQRIVCWHGFESCDGNELNGCETDVSSAAHCGGCDQACPEHASCVAEDDRFRCVCADGFDADDGFCRDTDECSENNGGCDSAAACENTVGGRACECREGYAGSADAEGSCVPALKSLAPSAGALLPPLQRDVTSYRVELPIASQTIELTATFNARAAVAIGDQPVTSGVPWRSPLLVLGPNVFELTVTEPGREPRHYTLTIERGYEEGYLKASNARQHSQLGAAVAIAGDTIVVGAPGESSAATGVDGHASGDTAHFSGAAYVFRRSGGVWSQEAYLKASNTGEDDAFGASVAVSGDVLVVGAPREASSATGVGGDEGDDVMRASGAAYVFVRGDDGRWSQQGYLKASNTAPDSQFGISVAVDGDTVVVGANWESSAPPGWTATPETPVAALSGAGYVFTRKAGAWSQQALLKAAGSDEFDMLGQSVAIAGDTIVAGAPYAAGTEIEGAGDEDRLGAAYVFVRSDGVWTQQACLEPIVATRTESFGSSVSVWGDTVVVGAPAQDIAHGSEGHAATWLDAAGAAHVFARAGEAWTGQQMLLAAHPDSFDGFGRSVAVAGQVIVVGATGEDSAATGFGGEPANDSAESAGAAYVFVLAEGAWSQQAYVKAGSIERASVTGGHEMFGWSAAVSGDTIVVGAPLEGGAAMEVDGDVTTGRASDSGAAYVLR